MLQYFKLGEKCQNIYTVNLRGFECLVQSKNSLQFDSITAIGLLNKK